MVQFMATSGGPHTADHWAGITSGQIIQIAREASGAAAAQGRALELKVISILEEAHGRVQESERQAIEADEVRIIKRIDPTEFIDPAIDAIVTAAHGTQFEPHFSNPEVREYIRNVLGQHFATSMYIERSWYVDRHPQSKHAKPFRDGAFAG